MPSGCFSYAVMYSMGKAKLRHVLTKHTTTSAQCHAACFDGQVAGQVVQVLLAASKPPAVIRRTVPDLSRLPHRTTHSALAIEPKKDSPRHRTKFARVRRVLREPSFWEYMMTIIHDQADTKLQVAYGTAYLNTQWSEL